MGAPEPQDDKVIITCALSGVAANRQQCPGIPYTPADYADESVRAFDQGCTIVHIHARKPDGTPTQDIEDYRAIRDAIKEKCPSMLINFSTGAIMVNRDERIHHIPELKPDIAALNMGTMNYAKYSTRRKDFVFNMMFLNPFEDITLLDRAELIEWRDSCLDRKHGDDAEQPAGRQHLAGDRNLSWPVEAHRGSPHHGREYPRRF